MLKTLRAPSRQSCTIWLVKRKPLPALSADKEELDVVKRTLCRIKGEIQAYSHDPVFSASEKEPLSRALLNFGSIPMLALLERRNHSPDFTLKGTPPS